MSFVSNNRRIFIGGNPVLTAIVNTGATSSYTTFSVKAASGTSSTTQNYTYNFGAGTPYILIGISVQNSPGINSVTVNGTSLAAIDTGNYAGNRLAFYGGLAGVTGSDTVSINSATNLFALDILCAAWSMTGLNSTTAVALSHNTSALTSVSATSAIGDFVFAMANKTGSATSSFTSTGQSTAHYSFSSAANGLTLSAADWIAASSGMSGTNFVVGYTPSGGANMGVFH